MNAPGTDRAERLISVLVPAWPVIAAGGEVDAVAATARAGKITSRTPPAARAGIHLGQRVRDAQRQAPALALYTQDPDREARLYEPIVLALEHVAVGVEVVRPGLCVLRAAGPARYYGGEAAVAEVLRDAVAGAELEIPGACQVGAGVGIGAGELAATLAAGADQVIEPGASAAFLAGYGLGVLARPQLARTLARLGITTFGQLAQLPAAKIADRFGPEGVIAHRLARGLDARPPAPRLPPRDLSETLALDPPLTRVDQLAFAAKAAADALHARLAALGLVADRIEITASSVGGAESSRWWRHGGALSSLAVAERVRWQSASLVFDAQDEADGISTLTLRPDGLRTATGTQLAALGPEPMPEHAEAALERLQVLLGHGAVTRPVIIGGREPGDRVARVPLGDLGPEPAAPGPWPGRVPDPPPAAIPPHPVAVELLDARGKPVSVSGRGQLSAVPVRLRLPGGGIEQITGHSQPWLAEERPWEPDAARRRARLQVATSSGRGFLLVVEGGAWSIHAHYQ